MDDRATAQSLQRQAVVLRHADGDAVSLSVANPPTAPAAGNSTLSRLPSSSRLSIGAQVFRRLAIASGRRLIESLPCVVVPCLGLVEKIELLLVLEACVGGV